MPWEVLPVSELCGVARTTCSTAAEDFEVASESPWKQGLDRRADVGPPTLPPGIVDAIPYGTSGFATEKQLLL
jgi:hypothetical protein